MADGFKIDTSGLDNFVKQVKEVAKPQQVGLDVLLSDAFLRKHTRFQNIAEFEVALDDAGASEAQSLDDLNTDEVNAMVAQKTDFKTLEQMLQQAGAEHFAARLKF